MGLVATIRPHSNIEKYKFVFKMLKIQKLAFVKHYLKENHGTGVSVENSNLKITIELYERIIAEKAKYISYLEKQIEKL